MTTSSASAAVFFTGDAPADFPPANFVGDQVPVDQSDVGSSITGPDGRQLISGWDLRGLFFAYDPGTDTASFGLDFFGIAGDADGLDGPNTTSSQLQNFGGEDTADLAGSESIAGLGESIAVFFDVDRDGTLDFVAGVPAARSAGGEPVDCIDLDLNDCFGLFDLVSGDPSEPGAPFDRFAAKRPEVAILGAPPSAARPDFEFAIPNWSNLVSKSGIVLEPCGPWSIDVRVFAGSSADDGIGEDYLPQAGVVTLNFPAPVAGLCSCEEDLAGAAEALQSCENRAGDSDSDGAPDPIDQCPGTGDSVGTDLLGCSQEQFCAKFGGRGWWARLNCKLADWQNDEPLWARDCHVRRGKCVPRL